MKVDTNVANFGEALTLAQPENVDYIDIASWVFIGAGKKSHSYRELCIKIIYIFATNAFHRIKCCDPHLAI